MRRPSRFIANAAGWLSRSLGRGGGTTVPGVVLLKLRPQALAEYAQDLRHGSVLCSATNGKTTTTRLLAASARAAGYTAVTNAEGSNLERGIAAALLKGSVDADLGVFEVDEAALPAVGAAMRPGVIVLMNLFRDQLDRYGELEAIIDKWRDMLDALEEMPEPPTLVLNADDPNIADLGRDRPNVVWFGLDDPRHGMTKLDHAADATNCRRCGAALEHSLIMLGHLGHWHCPNCDAVRPEPTVRATGIELKQGDQSITIAYPEPDSRATLEIVIDSALPGLHNSYNVTAGFAASLALSWRNKRPLQAYALARAIGETQPAFGRGETIDVDGKTVQLLLAKNPTGVNQNVRTILTRSGELDVLVLLNDRTADGQDVSWIWDVDWEPLKPRLRSLTLGGDRAWDLALRFRYGGFDMDRIKVAPDVAKALDVALTDMAKGDTLHALPTYTAMLDLRWVLTDRGFTTPYWSDT